MMMQKVSIVAEPVKHVIQKGHRRTQSNKTITESAKRHRRTEWNQDITQSNASASEMEHATAWKTSETEYDVRVPARYREYTCAHRVVAIYRRYGIITDYQYRVSKKELEEIERIVETRIEPTNDKGGQR